MAKVYEQARLDYYCRHCVESYRSFRFLLHMTVILSPAVGRRISGNISDLLAVFWHFGQGFSWKSLDKAIKADVSREILRPKKGSGWQFHSDVGDVDGIL